MIISKKSRGDMKFPRSVVHLLIDTGTTLEITNCGLHQTKTVSRWRIEECKTVNGQTHSWCQLKSTNANGVDWTKISLQTLKPLKAIFVQLCKHFITIFKMTAWDVGHWRRICFWRTKRIRNIWRSLLLYLYWSYRNITDGIHKSLTATADI